MIEYAATATPTSELEIRLILTLGAILAIVGVFWAIGYFMMETKKARLILQGIMVVYIVIILAFIYKKYDNLQYREVTKVEATLIPGELVGTIQCGKSFCNQVYVRYATAEGPVTLAKALGQVYPEKATLYKIYTK